MHILLVNDDGFDSEYLHLLCRAAAARGHRVTVCAPDTQQSAKSHAFTIFDPVLARQGQMAGANDAWRVSGTPVDACRLGLMELATEKVDLVISGINNGWNIGLATFVSGTCGAAREAAFQGYPAMAVSLEPGTPEESITFFADYCIRTGEKLVQTEIPACSVLNLNMPKLPLKEVKAPVMCGLNRTVYADGYERRVSPRGQTYFWLKYMGDEDAPTPGADQDMLNHGHVTLSFLTPEGCDQTAYVDFPVPLSET
ncbi:MAG: 5'/3'-nucleotidase SurE [Clostridia bacterium]|nr:5'/3'-nucleotidase SurE [Clostridia bacterium]MBR1686660.1 5'/3'-nucleotidase SurE [Clostridia bacterium]